MYNFKDSIQMLGKSQFPSSILPFPYFLSVFIEHILYAKADLGTKAAKISEIWPDVDGFGVLSYFFVDSNLYISIFSHYTYLKLENIL